MKFVLMNCEDDLTFDDVDPSKFTLEDKWILSRMNQVIKEVTDNFDNYEFGVALSKINSFIWEEYCDWYIEIAKSRLFDKECATRKEAQFILNDVLGRSMQLLHPFMPFLSEEVYRYLVLTNKSDSIMISSWPEYRENEVFPAEEKQMEILMDAIRSIRNVRTDMGVIPSRKIGMILVSTDAKNRAMFVDGKAFLERLANVTEVETKETKEGIPDTAVACVCSAGEIYIPLEDLIDIDKELERLGKEKERLEGEMKRVNAKLANEEFVKKAPEKVINAEREKQAKYQEMLDNVLSRIDALNK